MTDENEKNELYVVKKTVEEFFLHIGDPSLNTSVSFYHDGLDGRSVINIDVEMSEPQMLIGQKSQNLFDVQRLLTIVLNKKLKRPWRVNVDVNGYKKRKVEYFKNLAHRLADEASFTKEKKILPPMESYERRIIHMALTERNDVATESQGEGNERKVVIIPQ